MPWDLPVGFPMSVSLGETAEGSISIATGLETVLEAGICGEL